MKQLFLKGIALVAICSMFVVEADAQRGRSRSSSRRTDPDPAPAEQQTQQQQNSTTAPKYDPYGGIPIENAPVAGGISDSSRKSMRNDAAFDKSSLNERTPLDYEHLRWDDALYVERVWREIDVREKINMPFRYRADDDNGDQRFVSILLNAVRSGEVTAFDANTDDRFTTPLELDAVKTLISGGKPDTIAVYGDLNDPTKITKYSVVQKAFDPDEVHKFRIKEEWVFDKEASRMFVRILGIAPIKTIYSESGSEMGSSPMFWVYYPDMRPILAKYEVYNGRNMGTGRMTWEELFESRMFSSYIVKSSLDNPLNQNIRSFIKDPILALLEGENIKEKIFNYEQDLWSY